MKQLSFLIGLSFLLNLIFNHSISGQANIQMYEQTALLKDSSYIKRSEVFLLTQFDSTQQILKVYVINSTDSTALLNTFNYERGPFKIMIKDTRSFWKEMSSYRPCYPHPNYKSCIENQENRGVKIGIPPNSYIWKSYSFKNRVEDFRTKLKPYIKINNKVITIDPIEVIIDRSEALTEREMILNNINELLLEKDIKPEKWKELILEKVRCLSVMEGRRKEAFELVNGILKEYPNSNKAIYLKGMTLARFSSVKGLSKANKFMLINAAITELDKVKLVGYDSYYYDKAKKDIKKFKSAFPSRVEWELINDLECKERDDKYFCYEKEIFKGWVLIRFSSD